jgi:arylesterase/paraoxonase
MRSRIIIFTIVAVVLVIGGYILSLLWRAGTFRRITPHFAGTCTLIEGPVGPEDITIHPRSGVAYVSACDRRALMAAQPVPGAIYAYDLSQAGAAPVNLTPKAGVSFQPHGISLWVDPHGHDVLFVVNHPPRGSASREHTIEIFDVEGSTLFHRATLADPLLVMPNDIVAVGLDRFYVTNTHRNPPGFWQTLETYLQRPGAQLIYYGEGGFRVALSDLTFPNGVNVSADGRSLYLAMVTPRSVHIYDRDPVQERLTLQREVFVDTGPDNIEVDAQGNLWIGAHPKLLAVAAHLDGREALAPSQVVRVTPAGIVDEVFLDGGERIAAASVAAVRGQRLLIGQIAGNGFLDCTMAETPAP